MSILQFPRKAPQDAAPTGPAEISTRTIHGYRRAFVDVGKGPALLLIHGIGDSSDSFRAVIPELSRKYRVIAPDLLGHGRSDKPRADYSIAAYANAMRDLLSVLDVERVTVVGHSLGGGVAMQFAYQYPERCERLVVVSTGGVSREVHWLLRLAAAPNADFVLPLLQAPGARFFGDLTFSALSRLHTDLGRDAPYLRRLFEALPDATSRRAFVRTLRAAVDMRGQAITMLDRCYLARGLPALLVWGGRDPVIPVEHAHLAHAAMPGSRLEVFENAGHFPHLSEATRFLGVLEDFLATTEGATHDAYKWRALLREGRAPLPGSVAPQARSVLRSRLRSAT